MLVHALVFVLVDELGPVLIDVLLLVLFQVVGYVFVKALVCVSSQEHFQPLNQP